MKIKFLLLSCLLLSAIFAQSQTPSTGGSSSGQASGGSSPRQTGKVNSGQQGQQSGAVTGSGQAGAQTSPSTAPQQSGTAAQNNSQQVTTPGGGTGVIVNDPNQVSGVAPGGNTNRVLFGGTNQVRFGGTNTGGFINESAGASVPPAVPFGTNVPFNNTPNRGTLLPTNNTPLAGSGTIQEPSGAANPAIQAGPTGFTNKVSAAADALFARQLNEALVRGGATKVFFPQTRSTVTIVNQNGSILLQGFVSSEAERNEIEARVKNSSGVTSVNNQLQVGSQNSANGAVNPRQTPTPATGNQR